MRGSDCCTFASAARNLVTRGKGGEAGEWGLNTGDGGGEVFEERDQVDKELVRVLFLKMGEELRSLGSHGCDHGRSFLRAEVSC